MANSAHSARLDWPPGWDRTPPRERSENRNYEVELQQAIEDLEAELDRLGVDDWRLSTALDHQSRNPNYPYANQPAPEDPGVVVRWSMDGDQYAVACDAYSWVRDNCRTVGLYVREKRKMSTRPVTTGEAEFANARLPSGEEGAVAADPPPYDVLGVEPDAPPEAIREAYRERVQAVHPDKPSGDEERFKRVKRAQGGDAGWRVTTATRRIASTARSSRSA